MKNYNAYIVVNKDGKVLNPHFIIGQLKPVKFLTKEEFFNMPIEELLNFLSFKPEDAEMTLDWYILACEKQGIKPEKLSIQKVQITCTWREV